MIPTFTIAKFAQKPNKGYFKVATMHWYLDVRVTMRWVCLSVCSIGRRPAEYILHMLSGSLRVELGLITSGRKCHLSVFSHSLRGSEMEVEIGHGD